MAASLLFFFFYFVSLRGFPLIHVPIFVLFFFPFFFYFILFLITHRFHIVHPFLQFTCVVLIATSAVFRLFQFDSIYYRTLDICCYDTFAFCLFATWLGNPIYGISSRIRNTEYGIPNFVNKQYTNRKFYPKPTGNLKGKRKANWIYGERGREKKKTRKNKEKKKKTEGIVALSLDCFVYSVILLFYYSEWLEQTLNELNDCVVYDVRGIEIRQSNNLLSLHVWLIFCYNVKVCLWHRELKIAPLNLHIQVMFADASNSLMIILISISLFRLFFFFFFSLSLPFALFHFYPLNRRQCEKARAMCNNWALICGSNCLWNTIRMPWQWLR